MLSKKYVSYLFFLIYLLIVLFPCTDVRSEDAGYLKGSSAQQIIDLMTLEMDNSQSIFYKALDTEVIMVDNNWYYGIIDSERNYYISFLLSDNDKDAIILSGKVLIKRDSTLDATSSYDLAEKTAKEIEDVIDTITRKAANDKSIYGFPECIEQYCSANFLFQTYIFFDPQQYEKPRIDSYGNNIQPIIYVFRPEAFEEIDSLFSRFISSTDQIQSKLTQIECKNEDDTIESTHMIEKSYVIDYNDHISVHIPYDDNKKYKKIIVQSTLMDDQELFNEYMDLFYKISDLPKNEVLCNYLSMLHGEQFAWEKMVYHTRSFNILYREKTYYRLHVAAPSLFMNGWAIDFSYDMKGIPQMTISRGSVRRINYMEDDLI